MSRAFIYGLWGSPELTPRRAKTLTEIERWTRDANRPQPWEVYCFGQNNRDWLDERGIPCVMLHRDPVVDFYGVGGPPKPWGKGQMVWGDCAIWRHKTAIIHAAMKRHSAVVWLDWDTVLREPLPATFWRKMAKRQPIQMSIIQYRRVHCFWRPRGEGRRIVPEGAFIYIRDRRIISRVNRKYAKHRDVTDQAIFAMVMDEMMGGWNGEDEYKARGFEPYCHSIYSQFHRPDVELFKTGGRITVEQWERRYGGR